MRVVDAVERSGQVRVENPLALGVLALQRPVDRLDRVVAATPGTKPVVAWLEPRLPLGFQRVDDASLLDSVAQHRDAERS
jgi:hypothetical protein